MQCTHYLCEKPVSRTIKPWFWIWLTCSLTVCLSPFQTTSLQLCFPPLYSSFPGFWVKPVNDEATPLSFLSKRGRDQQAVTVTSAQAQIPLVYRCLSQVARVCKSVSVAGCVIIIAFLEQSSRIIGHTPRILDCRTHHCCYFGYGDGCAMISTQNKNITSVW